MNVAINSTENMDIDGPDTTVETNVGDGSIQPSFGKANDRKDVGISLGQHDTQVDDTATVVGDESGFETAFEKEVLYVDTTVISSSEEVKETEDNPNLIQEEGQSGEMEKDQDVVDVDNLDEDDVPLVKNYGEGVAKRLRSNKEKIVSTVAKTPKKHVPSVSETPKGKSDTFVTETPKTRTKTVGVGHKKGWSKVKVKSSAGRSRKRKVVSYSHSEYDVEEDVQDIISSATKKSA